MAKKNEGRTDETIIAELQDAVKAHHEGTNMDAHIKALRGELQAVLTEGAQPCPNCGNMPHGIRQSAVANKLPIFIYEVGCLVCANRRAQALTREGAVENWNNEIYIVPPAVETPA